jgi:predicted negative regulator of RcsB-dependent stress response
MEVGSPEWIEASLAKLDELEQQRAKHETAVEAVNEPAALRQHTAAIERLSAEIKSLYAQLEAVAEDDEAEDLEDGEGSPAATQGDDELSAPHISAYDEPAYGGAELSPPVVSAPLVGASDNPFSSPTTSATGGGGFGSGTPVPTSFDDDLKPHGSGGKWVFLLVVLLGAGGVGGYFAWQNTQAGKTDGAPTPSEPEVIIKAAEVPDDTEAPNAVQGGDATISPNANGEESESSKKKKKKDEDETKPIVLKGGDGPL